ncbi:hypothetical protein EGW08_012639 [Elysia chlorotica]|uniref:Uncharacterized protein n=1 Tax=Elysia chlorotica TaxID=188477 RepID=A0A433TD97_ELYCH|nr:hypothetical protein EGW08_012639 [Elysia chlorotica]
MPLAGVEPLRSTPAPALYNNHFAHMYNEMIADNLRKSQQHIVNGHVDGITVPIANTSPAKRNRRPRKTKSNVDVERPSSSPSNAEPPQQSGRRTAVYTGDFCTNRTQTPMYQNLEESSPTGASHESVTPKVQEYVTKDAKIAATNSLPVTKESRSASQDSHTTYPNHQHRETNMLDVDYSMPTGRRYKKKFPSQKHFSILQEQREDLGNQSGNQAIANETQLGTFYPKTNDKIPTETHTQLSSTSQSCLALPPAPFSVDLFSQIDAKNGDQASNSKIPTFVDKRMGFNSDRTQDNVDNLPIHSLEHSSSIYFEPNSNQRQAYSRSQTALADQGSFALGWRNNASHTSSSSYSGREDGHGIESQPRGQKENVHVSSQLFHHKDEVSTPSILARLLHRTPNTATSETPTLYESQIPVPIADSVARNLQMNRAQQYHFPQNIGTPLHISSTTTRGQNTIPTVQSTENERLSEVHTMINSDKHSTYIGQDNDAQLTIKDKDIGDQAASKGISKTFYPNEYINSDRQVSKTNSIDPCNSPLDLTVGKNKSVSPKLSHYENEKGVSYSEVAESGSLDPIHTEFGGVKKNSRSDSRSSMNDADNMTMRYDTIEKMGGLENSFKNRTEQFASRDAQQNLSYFKGDIHSNSDNFPDPERTHSTRFEEIRPNAIPLRDEVAMTVNSTQPDRIKYSMQETQSSINQTQSEYSISHDAIVSRDNFPEDNVNYQKYGPPVHAVNSVSSVKHDAAQAAAKMHSSTEVGSPLPDTQNGARQQRRTPPDYNQKSSYELASSKQTFLFDGMDKLHIDHTQMNQNMPGSDSAAINAVPATRTTVQLEQYNVESGATPAHFLGLPSGNSHKLPAAVCNQSEGQGQSGDDTTSPPQKNCKKMGKRRQLADASEPQLDASQSHQSKENVNELLAAQTDSHRLEDSNSKFSNNTPGVSGMPNVDSPVELQKCVTKPPQDTSLSGSENPFPPCSETEHNRLSKENDHMLSLQNDQTSRCFANESPNSNILTVRNEISTVHKNDNEVEKPSAVTVNGEKFNEMTHLHDKGLSEGKLQLDLKNKSGTSHQKENQTSQDLSNANRVEQVTPSLANIQHREINQDSIELNQDAVREKHFDLDTDLDIDKAFDDNPSNDCNNDVNKYLTPKISKVYDAGFIRRFFGTTPNNEDKSVMSSPEEITVYVTPNDTKARCSETAPNTKQQAGQRYGLYSSVEPTLDRGCDGQRLQRTQDETELNRLRISECESQTIQVQNSKGILEKKTLPQPQTQTTKTRRKLSEGEKELTMSANSENMQSPISNNIDETNEKHIKRAQLPRRNSTKYSSYEHDTKSTNIDEQDLKNPGSQLEEAVQSKQGQNKHNTEASTNQNVEDITNNPDQHNYDRNSQKCNSKEDQRRCHNRNTNEEHQSQPVSEESSSDIDRSDLEKRIQKILDCIDAILIPLERECREKMASFSNTQPTVLPTEPGANDDDSKESNEVEADTKRDNHSHANIQTVESLSNRSVQTLQQTEDAQNNSARRKVSSSQSCESDILNGKTVSNKNNSKQRHGILSKQNKNICSLQKVKYNVKFSADTKLDKDCDELEHSVAGRKKTTDKRQVPTDNSELNTHTNKCTSLKRDPNKQALTGEIAGCVGGQNQAKPKPRGRPRKRKARPESTAKQPEPEPEPSDTPRINMAVTDTTGNKAMVSNAVNGNTPLCSHFSCEEGICDSKVVSKKYNGKQHHDNIFNIFNQENKNFSSDPKVQKHKEEATFPAAANAVKDCDELGHSAAARENASIDKDQVPINNSEDNTKTDISKSDSKKQAIAGGNIIGCVGRQKQTNPKGRRKNKQTELAKSNSGPPILKRISPIDENFFASCGEEISLSPPTLPLPALFTTPKKDEDHGKDGSAPALGREMSTLVKEKLSLSKHTSENQKITGGPPLLKRILVFQDGYKTSYSHDGGCNGSSFLVPEHQARGFGAPLLTSIPPARETCAPPLDQHLQLLPPPKSPGYHGRTHMAPVMTDTDRTNIIERSTGKENRELHRSPRDFYSQDQTGAVELTEPTKTRVSTDNSNADNAARTRQVKRQWKKTGRDKRNKPNKRDDPAFFQFYGENSDDSESDCPGRLTIRESGESDSDASTRIANSPIFFRPIPISSDSQV